MSGILPFHSYGTGMKMQTFLHVQLKNLPEAGEYIHGDLAILDLDIPGDDRVSLAPPAPISIHVSKVVGAVVVSGTATLKLRCRCDRCLTYFTQDLPVVRVDHQYLDFTADVLDLTEDVREDILLTFPSRCICRGDCQGLCPDCGQNLNVRECDCQEEVPDESPWLALDKLQLPDGEGSEKDPVSK